MEKTPYFIIIAEDTKLLSTLFTTLNEFKTIQYKAYQNIEMFISEKCFKPISGLFVDFRIAMKMSSKAREEMIMVDSIVPYFKTRLNTNGEISYIGTTSSGEGETFLRKILTESLDKPPRRLRKHSRHVIHLNLLVCNHEAFDISKSFKTNSDNLSPGGIYIISPEDRLTDGKVWVKFTDLIKECDPFECISRWHLKWGTNYKSLPGYGLEFVNLDEQQQDIINKIIYKPSLLLSDSSK